MKIIQGQTPTMVYKWLCQDLYDHEAAKDSISATSLLKPIQEYLLCQRHYDEIEIQAEEKLWSLFGSGVHAVLERIEGQGIEQEERLFAFVANKKVSGKFDVVRDNKLHDFKVTSAKTIVYGSRKEEWTEQLSIYRWLYWMTKKVKLDNEAEIIAILRDWTASKVGGKYPSSPIIAIPIKLLPISATQLMIEDKVMAIKEASKLKDDDLPECTKEERWWNEKKQEFMKCSKYCNARKFCKQLQRTELPIGKKT